MESKKLGIFISTLRKEKNMTQADLAKELNVTDKAVSKWERGLGFPDIQSIEKLADTLGVSVLELMRSERIEKNEISEATALAALTDTIEIVKCQRKLERRAVLVIAGSIIAMLSLILLIDNMGWLGFTMVSFPLICLIGSVALFIYGAWRKKNNVSHLQTFLIAGVMLIVPIALTAFLLFAGALGLGPVPN